MLILLGLLAMTVPLLANENVTGILGWLFLVSGATGLATMKILGAAGSRVLMVPGIGPAGQYSWVWC